MESIRQIVREVLSEDYNRESIETKKYSDEDYDWFEKLTPLGLDRSELSSISDLYTIHYGDRAKSIIKLSGDKCHINTISVIDEHKSGEIGLKILQAIISLCKSLGVTLVTVSLSEENSSYVVLFSKLGFNTNEDMSDESYSDKSQKLTYYLELNSDNALEEGVKLY